MAGDRRRKLCREEVAVVLAAVAAAVVLVQRFIDEHSLLLLLPGNAAAALQSSMQATSTALAKLQMMFALTNPPHSPSEAQNSIDDDAQLHPEPEEETIPNPAPQRLPSGLLQSADDLQWRENFRMSRGTFLRLLETLTPVLQRQAPEKPPATPSLNPERKLGVALYHLAHGATFKVVARRFGVGHAKACHQAFYEVCKGLEEKLGHLFDFPTAADRVRMISDDFSLLGMPNCCGLVGCTNFSVERPAGEMGIEYMDHTRNFSVVMQGVVDSNSKFLDISVGWPGCIPPAAILLKTRFYSRVRESQELLQGAPLDLGSGILIPQYVLGDQNYSLQHWLITPFSGPSGFQLPALFNKAHREAMRPLRRAFGMLKEQWQLLKTRQRVEDIELLPFVVAASCVLQNFLIDNGEPMPDVEELEPQREPAMAASEPGDVYGESVRGALAALVGQLQGTAAAQ